MTTGNSDRQRPAIPVQPWEKSWLNIPGREGRAEVVVGSRLTQNRHSPSPQLSPMSPALSPSSSHPFPSLLSVSSLFLGPTRPFSGLRTHTVIVQTLQTRGSCSLPTALCSHFSPPDQGQRAGIDQKLQTSSKPDLQESADSLLLTTNPQ